MKDKIDVVKTLLDALPFIKKFANEKIVIKYGGAAQTSSELKEQFAQDIVLLHLVGMKPIIVHGGGKSICLGNCVKSITHWLVATTSSR